MSILGGVDASDLAGGWWRRILVPVRGGPDAAARARLAVGLAASAEADVTFLYVIDERLLDDPDAGLVRQQLQRQLDQEGQVVLEGMARLAQAAGVGCVTLIAVGPLVETIVRVARNTLADLIVVGSHRQTWLGRLLGGSVAEAVLHAAPCAVLAIPPGIIASGHVEGRLTAPARDS